MSISPLEYIKFKKFVLNSKVDLGSFFIEFSRYYVKSLKDFYTITGDFYSIINGLKNSLPYENAQEKCAFEQRLVPFCNYRHRLLNPKDRILNEQVSYVDIVSRVISSKNRVLDVGGGAVPHSSILMKDYFSKVGAMDKFAVSKQALNITGIEAQHKYFDKSTSLDGYDYVVGNTPCSAIKSIVETCYKTNRGYLVKLCDCDLKNIAVNENNGVYKPWERILPEIDPCVNFYQCGGSFLQQARYAFHLDITQSQFSKVAEESKLKDISNLDNSFYKELNEYAISHTIESPQEFTQ